VENPTHSLWFKELYLREEKSLYNLGIRYGFSSEESGHNAGGFDMQKQKNLCG
jgi:hypothetical protein